MKSRAEITSRYAKAYVKARKKQKGQVLDEVVSVTGWSRTTPGAGWLMRRSGLLDLVGRSRRSRGSIGLGSTPMTR